MLKLERCRELLETPASDLCDECLTLLRDSLHNAAEYAEGRAAAVEPEGGCDRGCTMPMDMSDPKMAALWEATVKEMKHKD